MPTITDFMTTDEVMQEIGERCRNRRLTLNISIDQLATTQVLNRKTILSIEAGGDVRISSLIKFMRGLDMLANLNTAFPDELPGAAGISSRGQPRQKASGRRK